MRQPTRILALDLETTGTDPYTDRVVELYVAELDDKLCVTGDWLQRFNPEIPIPLEAALVHGIRNVDIANEPVFADRAARLQRLLDGALVVAYNGARFDLPLLHHELRRVGLPGLDPQMPIVDPLVMFRKDFPHTLSKAVEHHLGRSHAGAHGARADTLATIEVLRKQWDARRLLQPRLIDLVENEDKTWLDWSHCFYRDRQGIVRFGFGKHRDQPALDHEGYLGWMLDADFEDGVKAVIRRLHSPPSLEEEVSVA